MLDEEKIKRFRDILDNSEYIVCFTGAGTSTESGVKDYRSKDGIYNSNLDFGMRPEEILHHNSLSRCPEIFWDFYRTYFLGEAKPNEFHKFLKRLEEEEKLKAIVTQNIDDLFEQAGISNTIHIHGTASEYYCSGCGEAYTKDCIKDSREAVPHCPKCGVMIRPNVCLYGEIPDEGEEFRAIYNISKADTLIVAGTSLKVYPATGYLKYFKGKNMIILNNEETDYDINATLVFHEKIGEVINALKYDL